MANESLLITQLPDGTFHVKETEAAGENDPNPAIDQSVQSPDDVTALVQQWLQDSASDAQGGGEDAADGGADDATEPPDAGDSSTPAPPTAAAWNAEAKTRDPASGLRK